MDLEDSELYNYLCPFSMYISNLSADNPTYVQLKEAIRIWRNYTSENPPHDALLYIDDITTLGNIIQEKYNKNGRPELWI